MWVSNCLDVAMDCNQLGSWWSYNQQFSTTVIRNIQILDHGKSNHNFFLSLLLYVVVNAYKI